MLALGAAAGAIYFGRSLSADLAGLRAISYGTYGHFFKGGEPRTLPTPARLVVPSRVPHTQPNVLLVIHESLGAAAVFGPRGNAPALQAFVARQPRALSFPRASAVATSTCVAIPAMLSGLDPQAPREHFARAPLLWHAGRAFGYRTGLFSAQEFSIDFFASFFLGADHPDVVMTAPDYGQPVQRVNELGVADSLAIDAALAFVERPQVDRPFLAVVQLNGTHWPCWAPELGVGAWRTQPDEIRRPDANRCARAARYLDAQVDRLFRALAARGALDETLVIVTSDHGEVWRPDRPQRRYSYLDDVLAVPLVIHLPAALAGALPVLQQNARLRATHLDIVPTVLDAWGAWPPADRNWPALTGHSLLRPLPARHLVSVTDSSISHEPPGFAVFADPWKWVAQPGGLRLANLIDDPDEAGRPVAPSASGRPARADRATRRPPAAGAHARATRHPASSLTKFIHDACGVARPTTNAHAQAHFRRPRPRSKSRRLSPHLLPIGAALLASCAATTGGGADPSAPSPTRPDDRGASSSGGTTGRPADTSSGGATGSGGRSSGGATGNGDGNGNGNAGSSGQDAPTSPAPSPGGPTPPAGPPGANSPSSWTQAAGPNGTWRVDSGRRPHALERRRQREHPVEGAPAQRGPGRHRGLRRLALSGHLPAIHRLEEQHRHHGARPRSRHRRDQVVGEAAGQRQDQPHGYSYSDATSWTPVTDGKSVCFFDSTGEMGCWDMTGKELWRRSFPGQPEHFPFNRQHEPILFESTIDHAVAAG